MIIQTDILISIKISIWGTKYSIKGAADFDQQRGPTIFYILQNTCWKYKYTVKPTYSKYEEILLCTLPES